jgi:uncharacterized protein (DUF885 family)
MTGTLRTILLLILAVVIAALVVRPASAAPAKGAAAPVTPSGALTKLCDDFWQGWLAAYPTQATVLGDHRYDNRLEDISLAGSAREEVRLKGVLARAQAIDEKALSPAERVSRSALILECQNELDESACRLGEWVVDPRGGPPTDFMNLPDFTVIISPEDAANYVARCRATGPYVDARIANLTRGLKSGRVGTRAGVTKTLAELDTLLAQSNESWPLEGPLTETRLDWTAKQKVDFANGLESALNEVVRPGLTRYRDFLRSTILPAARSDEKAGLSFLPEGREVYLKRIRTQTSLDRTPEQLHQLGLDQVAKVRKEISELGKKVLGTDDIAEIQKKLRTDPAMHFRTADEVETKARETLARAKAAIPGYFRVLPKADCQVKVMGSYEAPHSTIAYYRQGAIDGSRPGNYMINTYAPETRPRYEAEALAFHESIPGHHLQIAIAQELRGVPEFRRQLGVTSFVEGWALYTERLADEMHLYSSDTDRLGMLSFDAWRACRLVVDTGMHAMGWTRQQAIDYMTANTVLAENNIANEVDRYLGDPGQALAYKLGQIEILDLRAEAKKRLGDRFDLKAFHESVLENGAVALPVLRQQVEAWIANQEGAK